MKKKLRCLFMVGMLMAMLCVWAFAAEPTDSGLYNISGTGVTLTPTGASAESAEIGGSSYNDFYANVVQFAVEASGLTENEQYLLLVVAGEKGTTPTEQSIVYIDQVAAAGGTVRFSAYPTSLTKGHYCVYLVGSGRVYNAANPAVEFDYYQAYTLGDVDEDGKIDSLDALMVLQSSVAKLTLTETGKLAANVNFDNAVDSLDALKILLYSVGKITDFNG